MQTGTSQVTSLTPVSPISSAFRLFMDGVKRLLQNKGATIGGLVILAAVVVAIFAPYFSPHDPYAIDARIRLTPPNEVYRFGTDGFGRDVLSRLIYGGRLSLMVGAVVSVTSAIIGGFMGLMAGYYKRVDAILMRILDGLMAFPGIVLNIAIMAALGASFRNVVIALTVSYAPRMARVVRSSVLQQKKQQYVEAAITMGASDMRIMFAHLLPNSFGPLMIQFTMNFAYAMLAEASLSFLGVGVPPEVPSWGNMLIQGRTFIRSAPWITYYSGLVIATLVLAVNLFGDGLRDIFDPKLRTARR